MLSVLIPVYNYDVTELVYIIHQQCTLSGVPFEIIVSDDYSTKNSEQNKSVQQLAFTQYIIQHSNLGNAENRNFLVKQAQYPWLLFLDADMIPTSNDFISKYLKEIKLNPADAYSGGIFYEKKHIPGFELKQKHGKNHEEIIDDLDTDAYLGFRGNNFLIKKNVFHEVDFMPLPTDYGYVDTIFGIRLKLLGFQLKLIQNPLLHKGLELPEKFITKTEKAVINAVFLENNHPEIAQHIRLNQAYRKIKKLGLVGFIEFLFKILKPLILKNLKGKSPSLMFFQIYKLGYFCRMISLKIESKTGS